MTRTICHREGAKTCENDSCEHFSLSWWLRIGLPEEIFIFVWSSLWFYPDNPPNKHIVQNKHCLEDWKYRMPNKRPFNLHPWAVRNIWVLSPLNPSKWEKNIQTETTLFVSVCIFFEHRWQTSRGHNRWLLVDKRGDISWTLLSTRSPLFGWIFVDIFWVNSLVHFRWIFVDTFF